MVVSTFSIHYNWIPKMIMNCDMDKELQIKYERKLLALAKDYKSQIEHVQSDINLLPKKNNVTSKKNIFLKDKKEKKSLQRNEHMREFVT